MQITILKKSIIVSLILIAMTSLAWSGAIAAGKQNRDNEKGQTLIVGYKADNIITKGPFTNLGEFAPNPNIYETLVRLTPDFQVEPLLATRWEYKGDNTWRFHLRKGIRFHDGQEFTADAVKFTLDKAVRPSTTSLLNLGEDSVKVVDKFTVDITPTKPNSRMVELLTHFICAMKAPGSDLGRHPVGTGPFKFVSYEKKEQFVVERNPDYWGKKAGIDRIVFKFIPDSMTRIMALQSGKVDVITHVPEEMVSIVLKTGGLDIHKSKYAAAHSQIRLRVNGPDSGYIIKDKEIRLAVGFALDRGPLIEGAWSGIGKASRYELPPEILGKFSTNINGFTYDPDRSKDLLDRAGWKMGDDGIRVKDGKPLVLTLVSGYHDWQGRIAESVPQIIQSQLKEVGIGVEIVTMVDPGLKEEKLKQGFGHMWLGQADQNNADPTMWPSFICHSQRYYGVRYNGLWSPGEKFDNIIESAVKTTDPEEARRLAADALEVLISKEGVMIPLALTHTIFGVKKGVDGLIPHPSVDHTLWDEVTIKNY